MTNGDNEISHNSTIGISELTSAVEDAKSNIAVDIDEAVNLKRVLESISQWREEVSQIAPKRSKRQGRGPRSKFTLDDLVSLIQQSGNFPIDTTEEVNRLQIQLNTVEEWRTEAKTQLEEIVGGFQLLHAQTRSVYGNPEEFDIDSFYNGNDPDVSSNTSYQSGSIQDDRDVDMQDSGTNPDGENSSTIDMESEGDGALMRGSSSGLDVLRQIKDLQDGAKDVSVITSEVELGDLLESVGNWCTRSFKYLNSPREIFDKRHYGSFDRFLTDGEDLQKKSDTAEPSNPSEPEEVGRRLGLIWGRIIFRATSTFACFEG